MKEFKPEPVKAPESKPTPVSNPKPNPNPNLDKQKEVRQKLKNDYGFAPKQQNEPVRKKYIIGYEHDGGMGYGKPRKVKEFENEESAKKFAYDLLQKDNYITFNGYRMAPHNSWGKEYNPTTQKYERVNDMKYLNNALENGNYSSVGENKEFIDWVKNNFNKENLSSEDKGYYYLQWLISPDKKHMSSGSNELQRYRDSQKGDWFDDDPYYKGMDRFIQETRDKEIAKRKNRKYPDKKKEELNDIFTGNERNPYGFGSINNFNDMSRDEQEREIDFILNPSGKRNKKLQKWKDHINAFKKYYLDNMNFSEIGDELDLSTERVRQMIAKTKQFIKRGIYHIDNEDSLANGQQQFDASMERDQRMIENRPLGSDREKLSNKYRRWIKKTLD